MKIHIRAEVTVSKFNRDIIWENTRILFLVWKRMFQRDIVVRRACFNKLINNNKDQMRGRIVFKEIKCIATW